MDIWSHTNDTVGSVRRCILNRIKANVAHTKIELFVGGELIDSEDDRKLIGQLNLKDKSVSTYIISDTPKELNIETVFINSVNIYKEIYVWSPPLSFWIIMLKGIGIMILV